RSMHSSLLLQHTAPTDLYTLSLHDALPISLLVAAASGSAIGGALAMIVFAMVSGAGLVLVGAVASKARALMHGPDALFYRRVLRSEEHTSELQSRENLVCRLLLEKKKKRHK